MGARAKAPEGQLAEFIGKFDLAMQRRIRAARKRMRGLLPGVTELVYDNYNFLVIGYCPGPRASEAIFSLAAYARGLNLFFLQGAELPDPAGLLRGSGKVVRSIPLETVGVLDRPEVRALLDVALARAKVPLPGAGKHQLLIRSVSAKQRPRRMPATKRG